MAGTSFVVDRLGLNLRSQPRQTSTNILAVLPQGHQVEKLAEAVDPFWWQVRTTVGGTEVEGFVAGAMLAPAGGAAAPAPLPAIQIPPAHLAEDRPSVKRATTGGWAYPLGEPGRPPRASGNPASRAAALIAIVDWLDVESGIHLRYRRSGTVTYCNVYAADYCYLAGAYLPRVWWNGAALLRLGAGEDVQASYGATVEELTANRLFDWLRHFGPTFGWTRVFDLDQVQAAANSGEICIACAQRAELSRPGHITAVVPEAAANTAARTADRVTAPLQSEAGWGNHRYASRRWWVDPKFREVGFWRNAGPP